MDITIDPNSNGLPGIGQLRKIVGASMTVGLFLAVLALIISAVVWAMGSNSSNPHLAGRGKLRSEEHTSELQSLMRISYAVFCLKKKIKMKSALLCINKKNEHKQPSTTTKKEIHRNM